MWRKWREQEEIEMERRRVSLVGKASLLHCLRPMTSQRSPVLSVTYVFGLRSVCSAPGESIPGLTDGTMVLFGIDGQTDMFPWEI